MTESEKDYTTIFVSLDYNKDINKYDNFENALQSGRYDINIVDFIANSESSRLNFKFKNGIIINTMKNKEKKCIEFFKLVHLSGDLYKYEFYEYCPVKGEIILLDKYRYV